MKSSINPRQIAGIIGPFAAWSEVPENKLFRIRDGKTHAQAGKIVFKPTLVCAFVSVSHIGDTWCGLPDFQFDVLPEGFRVELIQD